MSIDPHRLLPGEKTDTKDPDDAKHWVGVYRELLNTKQRLVTSLREMMASQPKDVREELQRADVQMLEMQIERFELRLRFWQQREAALDGHHPETSD
jgi:hypothetical protein